MDLEAERQRRLRALPAMHHLLQHEAAAPWLERHGRAVTMRALDAALERCRRRLLQAETVDALAAIDPSPQAIFVEAARQLAAMTQRRLRPVINATGVVLHTNLGRALLAPEAVANVAAVAERYSTLEYDLDAGTRGSRHALVSGLLADVTGAEAAMVVNNNAAAVLLVLSAIAAGGEVIVSRGELVEIGGSFRIPDVMEQSGARLVEVGTTNKTRLDDYRHAVNEQTRALLKVHTSNFRIKGFTESTPVSELAKLAAGSGLPLIYDLGSGVLIDLTPFGIEGEPTVADALAEGADLVTFSGDKLLGGPQAGLIVGKRALIERCQRHPLARALRVDKLTLAALEATLALYRDPERALASIPTLALLTVPLAVLRQRAERLADAINAAVPPERLSVEVIEAASAPGGGSLPDVSLPTYVVSVRPAHMSTARLEALLRAQQPPVIARIARDQLLIDVRTVLPEQHDDLVNALLQAISK